MKLKRNFFSCIFLFISVGNLFAQEAYEWKSVTKNGYTYKYVSNDPTMSRFYTLDNGLTVILSPTIKEPRVQTYIAIKAGSKTDPASHTGLAHYLEHLLFKGTDKYGSLNWEKEKPLLDSIDKLYEKYNSTTDSSKRKSIYAEIDKVSGEAAKFSIANEYDKVMASMGTQGSNAFTSFEQTVYIENIPATSVDKFLTVQAERFRNPIFRIFHTELEAVYEEKNRGLDNDGTKSFEAMFANLFPNSYGKQTTIGTVEHLKNPSLISIRDYYHKYYVPNNMAIIMSGDLNPDSMIKEIDAKFSYMKAKDIPSYHFNPEKEIVVPIVKEITGPTPENIMIGFRFPGSQSKDTQLLELVGSILTNGKAGMFDLNLVKKQRLLSAAAFSYVLADYSTLLLMGRPIKDQSLDEVKDLMLNEIEKLKRGDFSDDLLTAIVNNAKKSTIESNESYESRAGSLMDAFTSSIDWKRIVSYNTTLASVTKKDIIDFANKYLNNNYVAIYKRKGEDKSIQKIAKPIITPVEVNRDAQSTFLKQVNEMSETTVSPIWLDFKKDISTNVLKGIDVLSVENKRNEIFRLNYRLEMGSYHNKLLPLAAEYLAYIGTETKTAEEISKAFYQLASSFDVNVSSEISTISLDGLQENFDQAVLLLEDLMKNCKADEEAWQRLKARVKKSREDAKLDKGTILRGLVSYAQYGDKNPFNYTLSDTELEAISGKQLADILHSLIDYKHQIIYYGPKSGNDITKELASLHHIPASYLPYPVAMKFEKTTQQQPFVYFANYDMVQAEVDWLRNSVKYDPNQTAIVQLFNNYFGGGMSGIVFQTIRESKALAYSTYAVYSSPIKKDDSYSILAYVGTQADKLDDAIAGMNELLQELPASEKVFSTSKESLLKSLVTSRITEDGIIFSYLGAKRLGVDYDMREKVYEDTKKLTFNDLKNFHDRVFKDKSYTYCIVANKERVKIVDLAKYGEVEELDLKALFGY